MARRNVEKTTVGVFVPAVRESIKGVQRTSEEIAALRESGKVPNVLWVGTASKNYTALEKAIKPSLEAFSKAVIAATNGKNPHATTAKYVEQVMESVRDISWQLPETARPAKTVDTGIDF